MIAELQTPRWRGLRLFEQPLGASTRITPALARQNSPYSRRQVPSRSGKVLHRRRVTLCTSTIRCYLVHVGQTHEGVVLPAISEASRSGHVLIGASELVEHTGLDHWSLQRELFTLLPSDGRVLAVHSITPQARRAAACELGGACFMPHQALNT